MSQDDSAIAMELSKLSAKEREEIYHEIHGVAPIVAESPERIQELIEELRKDLAGMPKLRKRLWERAVFLRPSLETDSDFMLMFLRAERYNASLAAARICKYFDHKFDLFGDEALVRRITLKDLSPDDMEVFATGSLQTFWDETDSAGRPIWRIDTSRIKYKHWSNMIKCMWYQVMNAIHFNEEAQIKGIVHIIYELELDEMAQANSSLLMQKGMDIYFNALPYKVMGMHYCYDTKEGADEEVVVAPWKSLFGRETRLRFRTHFGTRSEVKDRLLTYGIPETVHPQAKPITTLDHIPFENLRERESGGSYKRWISDTPEGSDGRKVIALYPTSNDVLLGRGRPYQEFWGNVNFGNLIEQERARYQSCTDRLDKTCIAIDIVQKIQSRGGHFLSRGPRGWVPVENTVAQDKVTHCFRAKPVRFSPTIMVGDVLAGEAARVDSAAVASTPAKEEERHDGSTATLLASAILDHDEIAKEDYGQLKNDDFHPTEKQSDSCTEKDWEKKKRPRLYEELEEPGSSTTRTRHHDHEERKGSDHEECEH